jgi:acyl-CoA thioesterase
MQVALAVRAMRAALHATPDIPMRSVQVTFVGPLPTGREVRLRAEVLRTGKSVSHVRCDMFHEGAVACTAVAIFGARRPSSVVLNLPRPACEVDPEALPDWPPVGGVGPALAQHIQMRWAAGTPPFTGQREPRSLIFARMRERSGTLEDALIALADSVPPLGLSLLSAPAPASSLNWMLEAVGDPDELDRGPWALIETGVRAGADGYLSQTSVLWGPGGRALSVSHQTVGIFG